MLNLDTHIFLFALQGSLKEDEHKLLANNEWSIASIVHWEIAKLSQLGRIQLDFGDPVVQRALSRVRVWPLTTKVAEVSTQLDFKSDPADELIAATSIVHGVPLLTRDSKIQASKLVPFPG